MQTPSSRVLAFKGYWQTNETAEQQKTNRQDWAGKNTELFVCVPYCHEDGERTACDYNVHVRGAGGAPSSHRAVAPHDSIPVQVKSYAQGKQG